MSVSEVAPTILETNISQKILNIIFEHALNKFSDSKDRLYAGAEKFLSDIGKFVDAGTTVEACLPAFPFKSANKVYKALGNLPDKAEELALKRLNSMCTLIQDVYPPGAKVTIISDGIVYNDLLCISDRETWAYGEALREMSVEKGFKNIEFSRMKDLLDFPLSDELREIIYVANCTNFRRLLINKYGTPDLDIDKEIATNPDTKLTYLGYRRFLESDLKHIYKIGENRTSNGYKRDCRYLAKQMLIRGYAFAEAVKTAFPNHLRLSIHESMSEHKLSMSLLDTKTGYTTPWHCCVALLANGDWMSAPMGEFQKDSRMELIYENGRPSYFKEKPREEDGIATREMTAANLQTSKQFGGLLSSCSTPTSTQSLGLTSDGSTCSSQPSTPPLSLTNQPHPIGSRVSTLEKELKCLRPALDSVFESSRLISNEHKSTDYGRRLIPQIMDSLANTEPNRTVFSLGKIVEGGLVFQDISARKFVRAVDKTAWWLYNQVGKPESIEPVGYIGPHDLRHILLTYACVKAGYAALYLSPKNNIDAALAVLNTMSCNIWVKPCEVPSTSLIEACLERRPMNVLELPTLDQLLDADNTHPFPFTKSFSEAVNEPFCFLHTSGTTGVPKPIPWSHGLIGTMDAVRLLPPVEGDDGLPPWTQDWKDGDRIYSSFPMSHGAGIIMNILMPALFNLQCILGPATVLPNLNLIESLTEKVKIDIWSMVPSLVDELGETPDVLGKMESSKFICASGGPVSPISGGKVNKVIRVLNLTGTTEGLFIGNLVVSREDWFWFAFHPYSGFEFREIEPDTYEHWVHRNENSDLFQGIFHTFPEKKSINFKDLYRRHPTKPHLWAFKGRNDDLVVLSNGYKISPLETEALITTHPAINGCLIVGTGKPQATLLIELKEESMKKDDEVLESIWKTVKKANLMSRHKHELRRNFIAFAQQDKPFIRTDKGTIKRPATLALYADYIERFYNSRNGDNTVTVTMDMHSMESVRDSIRQILASSLPAATDMPLDQDLFEIGLDSLGVFAVTETLQKVTSLQDKLGPRHIYANPTIAKLTSIVLALLAEKQTQNGNFLKKRSDEIPDIKQIFDRHRARQSFRLNAFDHVNPSYYMGLMFYLPLQEGINFEETFINLQEGLNRTMDLIPGMGGKIMHCSEQEFGFVEGTLNVTIPPLSMSSTVHNRLLFKDLSTILPSFEKLRRGGFTPSAFKDELVLPDGSFPKLPADILVAQANFVEGGCILAANIHHSCLDGFGARVFFKAWAENCRYLQGDNSATCDWLDSESFNHSLPEILHEQERYTRPVDEIEPSTWGFLPFFIRERSHGQMLKANESSPAVDGALLKPHVSPLYSPWLLQKAKKSMDSTLFLISPENVRKLKADVMGDLRVKGAIISISDIVQAFLWRATIRARYRVAKEVSGETFKSDEMSILELGTDCRPYFSPQLPETYMGNMLITNRSQMPVEKLCAPETSIGSIAQMLRVANARVTPSLVHDAFTLLQSIPDHPKFFSANMGLSHMHTKISNMILYQNREISFGERFFANGGSPVTMRLLAERANSRGRLLVIYPMKEDGGVEVFLGTFPEELEMLKADEEFTRYAQLVDSQYRS